jgi:hypothetical protein
MDEHDRDARMQAAFTASETLTQSFGELILLCRTHHFHDEAERLETGLGQFLKTMARRRETWTRLQGWET